MPEIMSNPQADRVRDVAKLSGRSARARRGEFLAEGPQAVREALKAHHAAIDAGNKPVVRQLFVTEAQLAATPDIADLLEGVDYRIATPQVLAAMATTVTPQGIVAACSMNLAALEDVLDRQPALVAVLAQVRDPGNAGTILRAADSAGADAVIFTEGSVDPYNPKTVRSTVGSLFHLPVVAGVPFDRLVEELHGADMQILAADGYGQYNLDTLQDESAVHRLGALETPGRAGDLAVPAARPDLGQATAWLLGNEAQGLAPEELDAADFRVAVPIYGAAESLNVATAATVCLYASARAQQPGQDPVSTDTPQAIAPGN